LSTRGEGTIVRGEAGWFSFSLDYLNGFMNLTGLEEW
jgi:hypothetical protein